MSEAMVIAILGARQLSPEQQQLREMLNEAQQREHDTLTPKQQQRGALIRSVRGKYAHLPISSESFAARKAEEIALEDRRSLS